MQGPMAPGSQQEGAVSVLCPDDGAGVAIAYVDAGGGCLCLVGEVGWLAFKVGREVHEPQHFDGVSELHGPGVWPVLLGPPGWGRR